MYCLKDLGVNKLNWIELNHKIPPHSNNSCIHFLTSTTPLSKRLKKMAPSAIGALSFPPILHGIRLSFLPGPNQELDHGDDLSQVIESIPPPFWLSRIPLSIPIYRKSRRRLMREILDLDHYTLCRTTSFHPHSLYSCICIHCGGSAHYYHERYCNAVMD